MALFGAKLVGDRNDSVAKLLDDRVEIPEAVPLIEGRPRVPFLRRAAFILRAMALSLTLQAVPSLLLDQGGFFRPTGSRVRASDDAGRWFTLAAVYRQHQRQVRRPVTRYPSSITPYTAIVR